MQLASVVTTSATVCLLFALSDASSRYFTVVGQGRQFKTFGTVKKLKVVSLTECSGECLKMGSQCGSFSFSQTKLCTINVMRVQAQHVQQSQQLFDVENGTLVYGSESYDIMPHGNVEVKETANYLYLLSHATSTWSEALELCQQFGGGFFLANIDDANELDSLRPRLTAVSSEGRSWVSGTDENHEGCWVWAAPVIAKLTDYTMWAQGQPNNYWGKQHCMCLNNDKNWNFGDRPCEDKEKYLCKRPVNGASDSFPITEHARSTNIC